MSTPKHITPGFASGRTAGRGSASPNARRGWPSAFAALALAGAQIASAASSVDVVSGGVGRDDYNQMNAQAADYTLKVVTAARRTGAWLADVDIRIHSLSSGDVLVEHRTEGPMLLARLPPGRYEMRATYADVRPGAAQTVVRRFSVGSGLTQMVLHFDGADDGALPSAAAPRFETR